MIRLSHKEVSFLLELPNLTLELNQTLKSIPKGGEISDLVADELRDLCLERMDVIGFDKNYVPTKLGAKLEMLIDRLLV